MNHYEDEQIVTETAAVVEAGARALLAARQAVRKWAQDRENQAQRGPGPQPASQAEPAAAPRQRRGLFSRLKSWLHNRTRPRENSAAQQSHPGNSTAQQPHPVEERIARWASAHATWEYAREVEQTWAQRAQQEAAQLQKMGVDPNQIVQRANQIQTSPTPAVTYAPLDPARIARLTSECTLAELNAARAVAEQQQTAQQPQTEQENTNAPEPEPTAEPAQQAEAAPQTQATAKKTSPRRNTNKSTAAQQGSTAEQQAESSPSAVSKSGDQVLGYNKAGAKSRSRSGKKATESEASAGTPQQLPPQSEASAGADAGVAP
ncbi:hypothetical protein [Nocardia heshunensis]